MNPATLATAVLTQATAEYVVTTLGRSAHAVGDALDGGWSFVTAHPWVTGLALVVFVYLARR